MRPAPEPCVVGVVAVTGCADSLRVFELLARGRARDAEGSDAMTETARSRTLALVAKYEQAADHLRSPLLLVMRLVWGWQFFGTGRGKLGNLDGTTEFFASLNIPAPRANALAAAVTECFGGLLLLVGFGARFAALALTFTMLVAYATAHRDSLGDLDQFVVQAPFPFLLASLVVLAFGAGTFSVDGLLARRRAGRSE